MDDTKMLDFLIDRQLRVLHTPHEPREYRLVHPNGLAVEGTWGSK